MHACICAVSKHPDGLLIAPYALQAVLPHLNVDTNPHKESAVARSESALVKLLGIRNRITPHFRNRDWTPVVIALEHAAKLVPQEIIVKILHFVPLPPGVETTINGCAQLGARTWRAHNSIFKLLPTMCENI